MKSIPLLSLFAILGITPALAQDRADTARVTGTVRDEMNAIALPGIPVEVVGTGQVVYTDVDGRYVLELPPGSHRVKVALEGYQDKTIRVQVNGGRAMTVDVGLSMARYSETVTVTGDVIDAQTSSAESQLIQRRQAQVITDNVGSQEMRANSDSDAASAMSRVTGLSVVDDQFVFVRGLGERYSNTTLNGAVIPTTEPDRKVVPLDLFPAGLLDSVQVAKTYTPDRTAEFAGGLVQIVPVKFPARRMLDLSYSLGFNSLTFGEPFLSYPGGGRDWLGFDDGTRSLPPGFPDRRVIRGAGVFTPDVGFRRSELEMLGESLANNWSPAARNGRAIQGLSGVFGDRLGDLGIVVSYTQQYRESRRPEHQEFFRVGGGEALETFSDYDFDVSAARASIGAVGNLSYQFSPSQRVTFQSFYTHNGRDETRTFEGFNADINTAVRESRLWFVEEELRSFGFTGEHFFSNLANSRIDWRGTRSAAQRDEPDLREVLYERQGGRFVLADESQSGFRMFNDLDDDTLDAAVNWSVFGTAWAGLPAQLKLGVQYVGRQRDFTSRRFRFIPLSTTGLDLALPPEQLFTAANIGSAFELREETRTTDAYAADQTTAGFYAMTDLALTSRTRLVGGVRLERFDQRVDTFDLFDFEGDPEIIRAAIEQTDVFPGVNVVYAVTPTSNLRAGFSQTVNRPEFRELAPFEFTDIVGGRSVVGNPDLQRSLIRNYDARWEWFLGAGEVVAASVFFKDFAAPIERIIEPTAQLRTSFTNAESARNFGIELELRKRLTRHVLVGGNYTYVNSEVTLTAAGAQVQTSLSRPLAGQSESLFNLLAEVRAGEASARLLYNWFDDRIEDVGALGLPDILEAARGRLDFTASARLFRALTVRFSAENLTDEDYVFRQGGRTQRLYSIGRTFQLNLGVNVF